MRRSVNRHRTIALALVLLVAATTLGWSGCGQGSAPTSTALNGASTNAKGGGTPIAGSVVSGGAAPTTTTAGHGSTTTTTKATATTTTVRTSTTTARATTTTHASTTPTRVGSTTTIVTPGYKVTVKGSFGQKIFTLADLHALPQVSVTVEGKSSDGPRFISVLNAAGVQDFSKVTLYGERGSTDVLTKSQASASDCIFDFTNRGTVKIVTPAYTPDEWTKDVYLVVVE